MGIVRQSELLSELGLTRCATNQQELIFERAIKRAQGAVERFLGYKVEQAAHTQFYPMTNFARVNRDLIWEVEGDEAVLRGLASASTDELQVQHLPVRRSTAPVVSIDLDGRSGTTSGSFGSETQKTEGTDYWFNWDGFDSSSDEICRDGIIRSYGRWPTTPGSVKVVYTAGYTEDELKGEDAVVDASVIWDIALAEAVRRAKTAILTAKSKVGFLAGPLESERMGDYSYKTAANASGRLHGMMYSLMPESREALNEFVNYGWRIAS